MRGRRRIHDHTVATWLVHGPPRSAKWDFTHHVVPPLSSSTTYRLDSVERGARGFAEFGDLVRDTGEPPVYVYDRLNEPTRGLLEGTLAELEGGEACVSFATGMAAISAALGSVLRSGDALVAHTVLYGCTHSLFANWYPRYGIEVRRVDLKQRELLGQAIDARTRVVYLETPANPNLELIDLAATRAEIDRANKGRPDDRRILLVVDNTFATPFCQRPIEQGADLVVHSLTKNLGGFGTDMGGAVVTGEGYGRGLLQYRKDFGGVLSSKSAWAILVYGLSTLTLRLKRQQYTAAKVAAFLEGQPLVRRVVYPGLESFAQRDLAARQMRDFDGDFAPGNMIYFVLDEKKADPVRFADAVAADAYSVTLAVSLGHAKTLLEMPGAMTHSSYGGDALGFERGGVRLSIGLESPKDICRDLARALEAARRRVAVRPEA
ncbi:MAG TPA: PLP-dependent aspartate aminotransferase family protein [Planctomycetota bacterium]|jgi:cystathionine beta-lyase/cystathionine gamma-synthase|nr:PLP-dependent aspartate aminotransferase family protein [Planctomycetota bacterium]